MVLKKFPVRRQKLIVTVQLWPEHAALLNALMRERRWRGDAADFIGDYLCAHLREDVAADRAVFLGHSGPDRSRQEEPVPLLVAASVRRYLNR